MTRAALAALAALAAGCSTLERYVPSVARPPAAAVPATAPVAADASTAADLVQYLARLRLLAEPALSAEATRARQATARDPSDVARVKAALAMSLAREPDEGDIVTILEPVAKREGGDAGVKAMASFLQVNAQERRRLREGAAAARASLRDERRALEAQKQKAESLQERAAQLQQKIDALTELEKTLSDRQAPTR